jgi:hypothetical protein
VAIRVGLRLCPGEHVADGFRVPTVTAWCADAACVERFGDLVKEDAGACALLNVPGRQGSFSPYRIILDPVHGLPRQPGVPGDLANTYGLSKHRLRTLKLLAAVARLASLVGSRVPVGLGVCNASTLRFLKIVPAPEVKWAPGPAWSSSIVPSVMLACLKQAVVR